MNDREYSAHVRTYQKNLAIQVYIRVCRDSGFQLSMDRAAHFAGNLLGIGAIGIWTTFGDLTNMTSIAAGTNPALKLPRYGGPTPRLNATDTKEECD